MYISYSSQMAFDLIIYSTSGYFRASFLKSRLSKSIDAIAFLAYSISSSILPMFSSLAPALRWFWMWWNMLDRTYTSLQASLLGIQNLGIIRISLINPIDNSLMVLYFRLQSANSNTYVQRSNSIRLLRSFLLSF